MSGKHKGIDWDTLAESGQLDELGTRPLARKLGVSPKTARRARQARECTKCGASYSLQRPTCRACGHQRGSKPGQVTEQPTPIGTPGLRVTGVSSRLDAEGNIAGQWILEREDKDAREARVRALIEAMPGILEPIRGKAPTTPAPSYVDTDLANVLAIGDHHLAMYAWAEEAGDDWDCGLAEQTFVDATTHLMQLAPKASQAVVLSLGDFFHGDSAVGFDRTPRSGNPLDTDGRLTKILRAGLRMLRFAVDEALRRHELVNLVCLPGNHDPTLSTAIGLALDLFYESNPRVTVDTSASPFRKFRWGKVLLGMTHGDTCKHDKLPGIMACDWPRDWGECEERVWLTGHVHHRQRFEAKDHAGCSIETFRTLAASDAWHTASGYRAQRSMDLISYHREWGEVNRHRVGIRQLRAQGSAA